MSIIDGRALAREQEQLLKERVQRLGRTPRLVIVQVGEDAASTQFVARKKVVGESLGIEVRVHQYPKDISTSEVRRRLAMITHERDTDGVVLQLPLPEGMNTEYLLNAIPVEKDVDVLSAKSVGAYSAGRLATTPPVVRASQLLLERVGASMRGKRCVVIGAGRLVGKPLALWLMREGAVVTVVSSAMDDLPSVLEKADVVFLGTGNAGLIRADVLKEGAIVIDAGSGVGVDGKIMGDFDPTGADTRNITYSPVPGGVGPLTVTALFENLVTLVEGSKR